MKLIGLGLGCVLLTLTISACNDASSNSSVPAPSAPASSSSASSELASARVNYEKHCAECHGPTAEGGTAKVKDKHIKVPSLKSEHAMKHDDKRLTETITDGDEEMPAFKDKLSTQDIADLVKLIRKEFQGK